MIRLIIADDHALFRGGMKLLLESQEDMEIVAEAGAGRDTIQKVKENDADILLLDLDLPDIDGIEVTHHVKDIKPNIRILVVTMHENEEYAIRALQAGAHGYVVKGINPEDLPDAIRKVNSGKSYITPSISEKIAFRVHHTGVENPVSILSDRELHVVSRVARGDALKDIAEDLCISPRTVETYKNRAMKKLGLKNVTSLIRFAIEHNMV